MTEERLKEIKDLMDNEIRTWGKGNKFVNQHLELYNEVVRLREIIKEVIKICEIEKNYAFDNVRRDEGTGELKYGNKIELDVVNKGKILDVLKQSNVIL